MRPSRFSLIAAVLATVSAAGVSTRTVQALPMNNKQRSDRRREREYAAPVAQSKAEAKRERRRQRNLVHAAQRGRRG